MSIPDFWNDQKRAALISQELANLKEESTYFFNLKKELTDLKELVEILGENEPEQTAEVEVKINQLEKEINQTSLRMLLKGEYDKLSAVVTIQSGAGGREAEDWCSMLLEMYQRYCQKKGYGFKVLSESFSEGGGPDGRVGRKEVTFEIKGKYVYGFLKNETGVHRLVRMSPFSANNLRHTSFCKVEVLPKLESADLKNIEIKPEEIRVDTYRSQGKGGQNVNKRETAIRVTHLPTGIVTSCQIERMQARNKEVALEMLKAKLAAKKEQEMKQEQTKLKGEQVNVEFGHQIRSYVFQPYQLVKDLRTQVETPQINDVMQGDLDKFVEGEIGL
ncbi:peptide chain release factor 2 [Candidatus Parcubacteria bacterium]|nr:peptide chain release factor 2 [Candidatus Parcubacteria bacterium]